MDNVIIEELTLTPIGESQQLDIKPIRVTVNGKAEPLIFDAREITAIKEFAASSRMPDQQSE